MGVLFVGAFDFFFVGVLFGFAAFVHVVELSFHTGCHGLGLIGVYFVLFYEFDWFGCFSSIYFLESAVPIIR